MKKLMTLTVGVPASGKTTWAEKYCEETGAININRDDIRRAMFKFKAWSDYEFNKVNEGEVTKESRRLFLNALGKGQEVVVSDTDINPTFRNQLVSIGKEFDYEVEFKYFHITEKEAIERDANRPNSVGKKVIRTMYRNLMSDKDAVEQIIRPYFRDLVHNHPNASRHDKLYVVDIDGTVAQMTDRKPYDWHRVGEDLPRPAVINTIESLWRDSAGIVFVSGRDGVCYDETLKWLEYNVNFDLFHLYMRAEKDQRPDWIVKYELLLQLMDDGCGIPTAFFDDRNQVVDAMRGIGMNVFQVAEGDF